MSNAVHRALGTTDATGTPLSDSTVALLQRRLSNVCLIYTGAYALAFLPGVFLVDLPSDRGLLAPEMLSLVAIAVSFVTGIYLRRVSLQGHVLMRVAVPVLVVGVVGIDFPSYLGFVTADFWPGLLSWACVWIVIFPLVVPGPPRTMTVGAFTAAAAGLGSFAAALVISGLPEGTNGLPPYISRNGYLFGIAVNYMICAGMAAVSARIIYGLQRDADTARRLGSYELESRLGAGGMGEVWLARHSLLARPAAVKLIRGEYLQGAGEDSQVALRRFEREARATAELRSPHTVQLYDFGRTEDGAFYYAMEYLDGLDLEQLVERFGPQDPRRVAHIIAQVCDSLAEAHERGLVHRDIKPSNVLIGQVGGHADVAKVVDFGLVKPSTSATDGATELTMEGKVPGTPAYMAPEIALSQASTDPRSDLYSVGCLAYWLLAGRPVFTGDTPMQVVLQHVRDEPVPITEATEIEVPPQLAELVTRLLAKEPGQRPATAREISRSLRTGLAATWADTEAREWWALHGDA